VAQNAFHASNGPGVYSFSYSFTSPVTGCTGSDQKSIVVQEAPTAAFEMGMSSSCTFPVVVPVTAGQSAGTTYMWKINGEAATALYFDQLGTYAVERIAVKNGCTTTATAAFEVKAQPEFDIVSSSTVACPGEEVAFKASGNANHYYLWSFSNGTEAMSAGIHAQFTEPGDVDVTVTAIADNGCSSSRTYNQAVHIHELPAVTVAMSVPVVEAGEAFVLEAANANQATWYFANGQSLEGTSVEATLYQTGEQRVTLEVQSAEGCVSRLEHRMEVVQQSELIMPGQFTPNQDGQNDVFRPLHIGDWNSFLLTVYDLQGRVVFQGNNAFNGWDGQGAQQGVYVYHVSAEDAQSGSATHQTGRVLLVH
jgi:gliding motility-associated-like protein